MKLMPTTTGIRSMLALLRAATGNQLKKSVAAARSGDYETALKILEPLAELGEAAAQYNLGLMHLRGLGVPQDDAKAVEWFRKAAGRGHPDAENSLGMMYSEGQIGPKDDSEALMWFRKAADKGYVVAQFNLGVSYANGHGVPPNEREAVRWYGKVATGGHALAQYNLGKSYHTGRGVPQNYYEAVRWYQKAAEQGEANAQNDIGVMYRLGTGVRRNLIEAEKWYRKAAHQGHIEAQRNLDELNVELSQQRVAQERGALEAMNMTEYEVGLQREAEAAGKSFTPEELDTLRILNFGNRRFGKPSKQKLRLLRRLSRMTPEEQAAEMWADLTGEGRPTIARRLLSVAPYVLTLGIVIFTAQWILEKFLP